MTNPVEKSFQKRVNPMPALVALARADPIGQVALLKEHRLSGPEVAIEKLGCSMSTMIGYQSKPPTG